MEISELKKYFSYDPYTGQVISLQNTRTLTKDCVCGKLENGYLKVCLKGNSYFLHRIIYEIMTDTYLSKKDQIDHINHNKLDNSWSNLRKVLHKENGRNRSKNKENNSGITGVHWSGTRWRAQIKIDRKSICLGSFVNFHEAVNARKNAEILYGFHENHGK